jgi:hypothetical protein
VDAAYLLERYSMKRKHVISWLIFAAALMWLAARLEPDAAAAVMLLPRMATVRWVKQPARGINVTDLCRTMLLWLFAFAMVLGFDWLLLHMAAMSQ